ncbi:hypothetical protein C9374_010757 [Naegleria lovaniensis]|uniref:Selenocysteine-specific elongation factor n=1 Tax=Naegleria lovaniensis TaxID=51637 RepID=A0AA88GGH7_NAELO|nr:uncharacterized protein C9374_010757 [Naegleria lovaniensis]KAG2374473.1 hypothetical protein C9374_010757 [Naegleria lovaniensis]
MLPSADKKAHQNETEHHESSESDTSAEAVKSRASQRILNVNVGILGHVDSGKTSLCKALSTMASTAAFDKNPQSQERGITLDLGFSAFYSDSKLQDYDKIQFTLVDCPGHASLIRTIIGGAQIIDFMVLVIDAIKGVQTQTAECIVIGEITCDNLIVALNKVDMIPMDQREEKIDKIKKSLIKNVFSQTKFKNPPIIPVCADPREESEQKTKQECLNNLVQEFHKFVKITEKNENEPFLFMVDHCFSIKGKGTILTGTVLQGCVTIGKNIHIPSLGEEKKVKSIQMFKTPVDKAIKGDRIGIAVTKLDSKKLERGFVCDKGYIEIIDTVLATASRIRFFKKDIKGGAKYHVSIGHETVMGNMTLISRPKKEGVSSEVFDTTLEYTLVEDFEENTHLDRDVFVKIEFEQPICCYANAHYIASKLDTDIHANTCRLSFNGKVLQMWNREQIPKAQLAKMLPVFKYKEKRGVVDRVENANTIIGKNILNSKSQSLQPFLGRTVAILVDEQPRFFGTIDSSFGQSGKFRVVFKDPLPKQPNLRNKPIQFKYKVNIYDETKTWYQ